MSGHGRKKKHHEEEEGEGGSERWLVTYADMLTLLLVLFIVLYSISQVNTSKLSQLRASLSSAFGGGQQSILDGSTGLGNEEGDTIAAQLSPNQDNSASSDNAPTLPNPNLSQSAASAAVDAAAAAEAAQAVAAAKQGAAAVKAEVDEFEKIEKSIAKSLASKGLAGVAQYTIDQRGLVVTIVTNSLVFPGNKATLLPGGQTILDAVVPPLVHIPNPIEVDGHTNQLGVSTEPEYPSGWELSSARASAVVRFMVQRQVPSSRLSAAGFSDQRPLYAPSDPRSVAGNRRVDVVILSMLSATDKSKLPVVAAATP
ncbi:chemotaxis protein MotB [Jatrophihabitans sp. GAS493]|uniref:OmpA/MotB family protein n=1 Tax=Jatrophihabitans sp. GAS493 TaxID=1907575 RepID=UPI000BB8B763|nr:flagellar motor protein MotB [Jatrophihabitans sp. GAS493]SOD71326.1 chemotaxis protein MotB [Jatrophihabitans sp. GAS493]